MTGPQTFRSNRRMIVAIAAMVVLWSLVMLQRQEIRARWWEHKLVHSATLEERARYLALLASLDDRAARPAQRLLGNASPEVRSFGLALLRHVSDERSLPLLAKAADDADADIREEAIRRLASIGSVEAIEVLIDLAGGGGPIAGRVQAIQCLGDLEAEQATDVLTSCLSHHTVFEGLTASEGSAARVLESVQPEAVVEWPRSRTVADFAATALERIAATSPPTTQHAASAP